MDIVLHPSLAVSLVYAALTGHMKITVIALISIVLHEAAHAFTAAIFGQMPRCMELSPLGAVLRLEDEYSLPTMRRLLVIMAGPACSFVLCWIGVICTQYGYLDEGTGQSIFIANTAILAVNLLPVMPLDGGRMILLLLERFLAPGHIQCIIKWNGYITGITLIILNLYISWKHGGWNLSLTLIGCCLIYCNAASSTTRAMAELRYFLDRKIQLEKKGVQKTKIYACMHHTPLRKLVNRLPTGCCAAFMCYEAGSMQYMGTADEHCVIQHYLKSPQNTIADCISKDRA